MANSSQLAKTAEALMAAALNEASAAASGASSDTVAELRHIHGIAIKLLASQEAATEKLLAGQEAMRQELAGLRAGQAALLQELAAARQAAAREGRAARLQRAIHIAATRYPNGEIIWVLMALSRGLTAIDMEACPGFSRFSSEECRTRLVNDLESLTGLSFRLEKKGRSWCLQEQQK